MIDTSRFAHPKRTTPSKEDRKRERDARDRRFREAVWARDGAKDRATGAVLERSHEDWDRRGQVAHLLSRRAHPEVRCNTSNGVLLSDHMHQLSDHRGGRLLRLTDPETGDLATDANKPIRFTLYDRAGRVVWERIS